MSAWHDPRGRLVVDGEGRTMWRNVPESDGTTFADFCRFRRFSCDATDSCVCVALWDRRNAGARRFLPHSCRPERHR